jgi:hypothetical protein
VLAPTTRLPVGYALVVAPSGRRGFVALGALSRWVAPLGARGRPVGTRTAVPGQADHCAAYDRARRLGMTAPVIEALRRRCEQQRVASIVVR